MQNLSRRDLLLSASAALGSPALRTAAPEDASQSVTRVWADAIVKARYEDLSAEVIRRTKLCILDNIGVIAHTSTLKDSLAFLERPLSLRGPAEATVWGVNVRLPLETATACNAYLVHHPWRR